MLRMHLARRQSQQESLWHRWIHSANAQSNCRKVSTSTKFTAAHVLRRCDCLWRARRSDNLLDWWLGNCRWRVYGTRYDSNLSTCWSRHRFYLTPKEVNILLFSSKLNFWTNNEEKLPQRMEGNWSFSMSTRVSWLVFPRWCGKLTNTAKYMESQTNPISLMIPTIRKWLAKLAGTISLLLAGQRTRRVVPSTCPLIKINRWCKWSAWNALQNAQVGRSKSSCNFIWKFEAILTTYQTHDAEQAKALEELHNFEMAITMSLPLLASLFVI